MSDPVMKLPNGDVLRVGDYGTTRLGKMVEIEKYVGKSVPWFGSDYFWRYDDGRCITSECHPCDIIAKWTDAETDDTPKFWRDMTPEEKGALLLADHEGKVIEAFDVGVPDSWALTYPVWDDYVAYRIKPEPKVETVTIFAHDGDLGWWVAGASREVCTHRITFTMTDGKMDVNSIKAKEL